MDVIENSSLALEVFNDQNYNDANEVIQTSASWEHEDLAQVDDYSVTANYYKHYFNRNCKLEIFAKVKSRLPALHRRLTKIKSIDRGSRSRESGKQTVRWLWWMVFIA